MKLKLFREAFSSVSTIGQLWLEDKFFCYTLEDQDRRLESGGVKVYGETCIPRGTFEVIIDFSTKYKKEMPHILNVPNFNGIRIHPGNRAEDSEGCILVGSKKGKDFVGNSVVTFAKLMEKLEEAYNKNESISIEII